MKINKMVTPSLFYFFILLAVIWLVLPGLLIPFCISHIKQVEKDIDVITNKAHQEIWSIVQNAATNALLPMSSSANNLAKVAASSLGNKTDITFNNIKAKVAPLLFQALLTIPHVSQTSYIGKDGMFFGFYTQMTQTHQQIFAIYSNTSLSRTGSNSSLWYTQPVDIDTGKLHGESVLFRHNPQGLVNESWLQEAMNTTNGHVSLGNSWNDDNNLLVVNTARVDKNGVISLDFELKSLMNVFVGIKPSGGGLYLGTKDGEILLNDGVPNTRIVVDGNTAVSIKIRRENGYRVSNDRIVTLPLNYEVERSYRVEILGTKYIVYSSPLNLTGTQSVFVLALPYNGVQYRMHRNIIFVFVLLLLTFITTAISIFSFIVFMVRKGSAEMCLRASLIQQKEATQQAERKSKNQNLAFVSASHDIRASLAGFDGLIEMSINGGVRQGSELAKNLRLMQECSNHLHSILNSILDTSKIEAGMMHLEEDSFDIVKVVEGVVDLFYPVGLNKEVDVILDLQDGSLSKFSQVIGDERRLRQILSNLLSNAIKFTSDGYVSVRARAMKPRLQNPNFDSKNDQSSRYLSRFFSKTSEKCVADVAGTDEVIRRDHNVMEFVFEVNDTGKGIPKEKQGSVFEQYVQVKETAHEVEGTGLGLAIVQSLVRLMGGEISIVDKVREKGTCFRFNVLFKVSRTDQSSNSEDEKTPSVSNLSPGSNTPFCSPIRQDSGGSIVVLFISSDARRKMTQKFLRAQGIKVLAVENIQLLSETLKGLRQEQSSVICGSRPTGLNLSFGYMTRSRDSSPKNNVPLSALDGSDVSPPVRRTNRATFSSSFVLLVIDTTRADFHELCKIVAEFRKNSKNACFRVVWLGFRCMKVHGLDEKQLPPSDVILPMPLHGSRLHSLIDLLPEFGGMIPCTPPQRTPSRQDEIQEISRVSPSSSPLRGKKVLLVEDDKLQQMIAKKSLLKYGVVIDTCINGEEALILVSKSLNDQRDFGALHVSPYEYIFMDCQMPVMDGCEATRQIRLMEKDYGVYIPIIGLTAHAEGEELNTFLAAGIDIHISKPLNEEKILKVVKDLHSR